MPNLQTDPKTTRMALYAILTFVVTRLAAHFGYDLPPDVGDGVVVLILARGLHQAADSTASSNPADPSITKRLITQTLAVALVVVIPFTQAACGPSRDQLVKVAGYGQQLSALIEANRTLPDSLLQERVINQATHDRLAAGFEHSRVLVARFNVGLRDVLAQEHPNPATLIPLVAELIEQARSLNILPNNETYRRWLAGVEVSLRAIANYFALQRAQAHAAGYSDQQLCRLAGVPYDPVVISTIETYTHPSS